jgi:hypothetical protein
MNSEELRWEAKRLLFEAHNVTDDAQRKSMRVHALDLAVEAKLLEKQAKADSPSLGLSEPRAS